MPSEASSRSPERTPVAPLRKASAMGAPAHAPLRAAAAANGASTTTQPPRRKFIPSPAPGSTQARKASTASSKSASSAPSSRSVSATHSSSGDTSVFATPKSSIASLRKAAAATKDGIGASSSSATANKTNVPTPVRSASIQAPTKAPSNVSSPTKKTALRTPAAPAGKKAPGDGENEPIKAFLRIRPTPEDGKKEQQEPYIEVVSDTEVLMNPPSDAAAPRARVYSSSAPTKYAFSRIFRGDAAQPSETSQSSFFQSTTLPLVDELLQGQSGLVFTYGVTNSGKSYTVQGGHGAGEAGILPRSMDVIFNSIKGLESTSDIRPVGLAGVEQVPVHDGQEHGINPFSLPALSKKVASQASSLPAYEHEDTKVRVDRNYRYSVWVSYMEVYNEKIFDLLDAAPQTATNSSGLTPSTSTFGSLARSGSFRGMSNWSLAPSEGNTGPIYLQRKPLSLKSDIEAGGKHVAGLQEIRVHSPEEAHELMRRGQENRRVFATMANRASSRSHGVFTVKVIREHAGEDDWSIACSTSRLSIVDLAGSERLTNSAATGERLKEAGNINKSLMCLGQCLETLRKNQARAASMVPTLDSKASSGSSLPRLLNRRPSIVPFRHSKLTELFQSFFTGEGRAVMIVNVNPYDTGFDENAHVMRFSSAAKEVQTVRSQGHATNLSRFVHPSLRNLFHGGSATATPPPLPRASNSRQSYMSPPPPSPRFNTIRTDRLQGPTQSAGLWTPSFTSPPQTPTMRMQQLQEIEQPPLQSHKDSGVQAAADPDGGSHDSHEITIVEGSDDEDGDSENDPFVEHLMQKYEETRQMLFESEIRCAIIERQIREEMAEEMSERLLEMERLYNARMLADTAMNEEFVNRKLDLMVRASTRVPPRTEQDVSRAQPDENEAEASYDESALSSFVDDSADDSRLVEHTLAAPSHSTADAEESMDEEDSYAESDDSVVMAKHTSNVNATPRATRRIIESDESADDSHGTGGADEDGSILANESSIRSPAGAGADAISASADASIESVGEASQVSHAPSSGEKSLSNISINEDRTDKDAEADASGTTEEDGEESEDDADEEEEEDEEEDEEEEESEEDDESDDTSDESFDVTEESIESSFEAPPKARTSRARQSAAVRGRASAPRRRTTTTRPTAKAAATPRARGGATSAPVAPLGESSAGNISHEASSLSRSTSEEFKSDASLIIVKKKGAAAASNANDARSVSSNQQTAGRGATTPGAKKKRVLGGASKGRRTNPLSQEAQAMEELSDVSLMEAMQRRIVS